MSCVCLGPSKGSWSLSASPTVNTSDPLHPWRWTHSAWRWKSWLLSSLRTYRAHKVCGSRVWLQSYHNNGWNRLCFCNLGPLLWSQVSHQLIWAAWIRPIASCLRSFFPYIITFGHWPCWASNQRDFSPWKTFGYPSGNIGEIFRVCLHVLKTGLYNFIWSFTNLISSMYQLSSEKLRKTLGKAS